jgi:hypothetical protein
MACCSPCRRFLSGFRYTEPVRTWSFYTELKETASECEICKLCMRHVATYYGPEKLYDSSDDKAIRLKWDKGSLSLECEISPRISLPMSARDLELATLGPLPRAKDILEQANNWLRRCTRRHRECRIKPSSTQEQICMLPKRLIDLTHHNSVVIVDCRNWAAGNKYLLDELGRYCTLSYRWGDIPHDYVLKESFDMLLEMSPEPMPQVFKDAFSVARGIGVRFIWIDALCIVQPVAGNDEDWLEEGYRMGTIYANSLCTIAATCAVDAHQGFLAVAESGFSGAGYRTDAAPANLDPPNSSQFFSIVSQSPLNERGWVMQERALSRRVIHFTEQGIFWECCMQKSSDRHGDFDAGNDHGACRHKESLLNVSRARQTRHLCPVEWFHFIKQYSWAKFTNPHDRLIALSSVARAVEPIIRSDYLAGIWRNDLIRGLQWHCFDPETRPRIANVPTWSWASVSGGIEFTALAVNMLSTKLVEILDVQIQPDEGNDSYGYLLQGKLKIQGTLVKTILSTESPKDLPEGQRRHEFWDEVQGDQNTDLDSKNNSRFKERWCTVLPTGIGIGWKDVEVGALILEPIGDTKINSRGVTESLSGQYRRIGWLQTDFDLLYDNFGDVRGEFRVAHFLSQMDLFMLPKIQKSWMVCDPTQIYIV